MIFDLIIFIFVFTVLLGTASLFMCGWYVIARGEFKFKPDGTPFRVGKIFKGWHFFWTQEVSHTRYNVQGKPLKDIYFKLYESGILKDTRFWLNPINTNIMFDGIEPELLMKKFPIINRLTDSKVSIIREESKLYFSKTEPVYRFPEWLRSPLSSCIYCYSSVYGSIFYWIAMSLPAQNLFVWTEHQIIARLFFWVVFCISSSAVNGILIKRVL